MRGEEWKLVDIYGIFLFLLSFTIFRLTIFILIQAIIKLIESS